MQISNSMTFHDLVNLVNTTFKYLAKFMWQIHCGINGPEKSWPCIRLSIKSAAFMDVKQTRLFVVAAVIVIVIIISNGNLNFTDKRTYQVLHKYKKKVMVRGGFLTRVLQARLLVPQVKNWRARWKKGVSDDLRLKSKLLLFSWTLAHRLVFIWGTP